MRVFLIALLVLAGIVPARAADLKLLTAGAFKPVAVEIVAEFEKRTGNKVTIDNDTAGGLSKRVAAGEYFDVVIMPPLVLGPFLGSKLVESSAKPLARAGIGVAVKEGAAEARHLERRQLQEGAAGGALGRLCRSCLGRLERHLSRQAVREDGHRRSSSSPRPCW